MRHIVTIVLFSGLAFATGWTLCGLASNKTYAEGLLESRSYSINLRTRKGYKD